MANPPSTEEGASGAVPKAAGDGAGDAPAPGEPSGPPPVGARRPPRLAVWISVAVIVAGAGALVWARITAPQPESEAPRADAAVAALDERLTDLAARLAAVEAADVGDTLGSVVARIDGVTDGVATLDDRLADMEERVAILGEAPAADAGSGLAALDDRVAEMEERFTVLREAPASGTGAALAALDDRVASLEAAPGADGALAAIAAEADRLAALAADLDRRIATLEARPAPAGAAAAALLAVAQLRAALAGSGPYDAALAALRAVADGDAEVAAALDTLAAGAAAGMPTLAMLQDRFAALAGLIVRAGHGPSGESWVDLTLARLAELVTVRRVGGTVPGDSPEAVVARAEARLAAGELAAAVAEVGALAGAPGEAAAGWLAEARARLAAERALAALEARAVAALGGG